MTVTGDVLTALAQTVCNLIAAAQYLRLTNQELITWKNWKEPSELSSSMYNQK